MKDVSLISVYNSKTLFDNMVDSFKQTTPDDITYEIIPLDNRQNRFKSAAEAYNYAIDNLCNGECLIFCHQDIVFYDGAVEKIYNFCKNNQNTLCGAAGVKSREDADYSGIVSTIYQNSKGMRYNNLKGESEEVFTLDECLIAGSDLIFKRIKFNEVLCSGWSFYTTEFCLNCHINKIKVCVIDCNILHLSSGNINKNFHKTAYNVSTHYRKRFMIINYTWGWNYTNPIKRKLQYFYRIIRYR